VDELTRDQQRSLLRRFEPVIRYTRGELFLPAAIESYISGCQLVVAGPDGHEVVAPRGSLTPDKLAEVGRLRAGQRLSLERVEGPLDRAAYRAWRHRPDRPRFKPVSRFAAVGLLARLVDAGLRLTLLLRGRIPGGFTAAAQQADAATPAGDSCPYYGHVTDDAGYVVVQYWYFYAMNDWRSSFGGINDHEADWEQVTIFLTTDDSDGELHPAWVAFSAHDEVGDDLRRRRDDPDIEWVGEHPVVYAGAGSHSGAYLPGEYVVTAALPVPNWVTNLKQFWNRIMPWRGEDASSGFGIPYIDYRRGDGVAVGQGGNRTWDAVVIDDTIPWVRDYRGLWGLDTRDPLGGERAPAGPRFERSGAVRQSWRQPVAWAGLDGQPPTAAMARAASLDELQRLRGELVDVEAQVAERRRRLRVANSAAHVRSREPRRGRPPMRELESSVTDLRGRQAHLAGLIEDLEAALDGPPHTPPVHAHLHHRAVPIDRSVGQYGRAVRVWSAASASILLVVLGVMLMRDGITTATALLLAGLMIVIEAILRRRVGGIVAGIVVIGVALGAAARVFDRVRGDFADWVGALLIVFAAYLATQTVREAIRAR
jgi:hypothetical protein